jgi:tight adherence protein B
VTGVTSVALATAMAAAGGALLMRRGPGRAAVVARTQAVEPARPDARRSAPAWAWPAAGLLVLGAATTALVRGGIGPIALTAFAGVVGIVAAERARTRRTRARRATAELVDECVAVLAAELSAGRSAADALAGAASVSPPLVGPAARVAALGGDPTSSLRVAADPPGADTMRDVAAAWAVAQSTGAPLADLLARAAVRAQDDLVTGREVEEQLAPVRATARVLAGLPLMGLVLGAGLGVDVVSLLLTTGWGQMCLLAAIALVASGLWVLDRVAERARRPS